MNKFHLIAFFIISFFSLSCGEAVPIPDVTDENPKEETPEEEPLPQNANYIPNTYTGYFLYGSNMAYKNNQWTDTDVSDMLTGNPKRGWEGVGVNSLRPALYEGFVQNYGYEIRIDAFRHYAEMGAKDNVVFIGDRPSEVHREQKKYGTRNSQSYENLYEPIWDDGTDGTPVNENNYYAAYVYKLVQTYKDYVKFWEIKNEPDYTYSGNGDRKAGEKDSWWTYDPQPDDLPNWGAPIYSYIRLLRVSYEVIKHLDPEAYVCIGGVGYESFLDAILRNTDNPDGGAETDEYPYKGGAWFDCLSYHIYPMYYLHKWQSGFVYFRHSDAAVETVMARNMAYRERLRKYGYGVNYPDKEVIITEVNIPSKGGGDHIGSTESQRNFLIKTAIIAQKQGIRGVYPYCPWDNQETEGGSFDFMGFYRPIPNAPDAESLRVKESGIGWQTTSRLLGKRTYDDAATSRLNLPDSVDGGAFYSPDKKDFMYVLWAKTTRDMDETASAGYSFPESSQTGSLEIIAWDGTTNSIKGHTVTLTGEPVFIQLGQ